MNKNERKLNENEPMKEWTNEQMKEPKNALIKEWMNIWIKGWMRNDKTNKELNEKWSKIKRTRKKECTNNERKVTEWTNRRTNDGTNEPWYELTRKRRNKQRTDWINEE